jgi:hypothetical protein
MKPTKFCDNPLCETPAVRKVKVSVNAPNDEIRHYCATCLEAYSVGVQHGRMTSAGQTNRPQPLRGI